MASKITTRFKPIKIPSGIRLGIAEGKYADDFDEAFDAMGEEVAETFSLLAKTEN